MVRHFLNIAWRQMLAQKLHSAINIIGLATGICCFLLILLLAKYEMNYDKDFANYRNIYRVSQNVTANDGSPSLHFAGAAPQVAGFLKQDFSEIQHAARIRTVQAKIVRDVEIYYEDAALVDNDLFRIFDFTWLQGNAETALLEPGSAVLTRALAQKHFPDRNAVGEYLDLGDGRQVQITGVIDDLPNDTHLALNLLISMESAASFFGPKALENWSMPLYHSYVLVSGNPGSFATKVAAQSKDFFNRYAGNGAGDYFSTAVMPLEDVHLRSNRDGELSPPGDIALVYSFILIAVFILCIACINFLNLSTVRAGHRAKEVGVKKALGIKKATIRVQLMVESILIALCSLVIAWLLAELALPYFNDFTGLSLEVSDLAGTLTAPALALIAIVVGVLAGSYPAFYIAAFEPAPVLKGIYTRGKAASVFRKSLVTFQFFSVVILLIVTLTAYLQLGYLRAIDLGYDKDQIMVLRSEGGESIGDSWQTLRNELTKDAGITDLTFSSVVPGERVRTNYFIQYQGGQDRRGMPVVAVGYDFFKTYGMRVLAGREFSEAFADAPTATQNGETTGRYVINATAARQLGWAPEDALGKWIEVTCCGYGRGEVIGVVDDVYFESQLYPISPLIFTLPARGFASLTEVSVRVGTQDLTRTLEHIDTSWKRVYPQGVLSRSFMSDDFEQLYDKQQRQATIFTLATILGIFVACIGLLGITWFIAEQRKKEIGIRKVLGGSNTSIVMLFITEFLKLVGVAILLGWPAGYLIGSYWLEGFATSISIDLNILIASASIVLALAALTVGGVAGNAARRLPIVSLRND
jgi:putative ABC transport system permease protein